MNFACNLNVTLLKKSPVYYPTLKASVFLQLEFHYKGALENKPIENVEASSSDKILEFNL
eukprot:m.13303 g.13303  ORF g.13303 m.13303 type:complete len:60 (-) comp4830_c0_seq1:1042-1221(-)